MDFALSAEQIQRTQARMRKLNPGLIPTPLIADSHRPAVTIAPSYTPSLFPAAAGAIRLLWWFVTISWLRVTGRGTSAEYGRRFRALLEDMGGLWVKVGQLLSLRVDLFPQEFCRELSHLQVKAIGFPPAEAVGIVEAELGQPVRSLFVDFDEAPIAAASIGQVHLARLRESGTRVAVKVQRPHLPWMFRHQLRVVRWIVALVKAVRFRSHMRWEEMIWELDQIMHEEMDCRYEASSTKRMRRTLAAHGIYAPKVFYATRRVLVTEFIDGVLMADYIQTVGSNPDRLRAWLEENGVDPQTVGERLSLSLLRQLMEDDLFHGDLHPGNVMLLRNSRVALIDFGSCSFTERSYLERFRMSTRALIQREYTKAADLSLQQCGALPDVDIETIRNKFIQAMRNWAERAEVRELPYHDKSVPVIYNELIRILYEHQCTMGWSMLRISRALETLDASLMYLFVHANHAKITARYFREADERALARPAPAASVTSLLAALDVAEPLEEYTLFQAEIIRRYVRVFQSSHNKAVNLLRIAVSQLAVLALLGTALVGIGFLAQRQPQWLPLFGRETMARLSGWLPVLDPQIWTAMLAVGAYTLLALMRFRGRLRRHEPRRAERVAPV